MEVECQEEERGCNCWREKGEDRDEWGERCVLQEEAESRVEEVMER